MALPTPPLASDPANFDPRADAFFGALPAFETAMNALAAQVAVDAGVAAQGSAAAATALSAANFKGAWSSLTGAAAIPYAVFHSGSFWQLVSNLADVTTKTPGVDAEWKLIAVKDGRRTSKTGAYTVTALDHAALIDCSGTFTLSFTAAATLGEGFYITVRNTGTGVVTGPTADGATLSINPGDVYRISTDGTLFYAVRLGDQRTGAPDVYVVDEKATSTQGGATSATTWNGRTLNTVKRNVAGASLASNQVTLPAGTWWISADAPALRTGAHMLRLRNVTDSTVVASGVSEVCATGDYVQTRASVESLVTITSAKAFDLQHYTTSSAGGNGLGDAVGISGVSETYARFRAWRIG